MADPELRLGWVIVYVDDPGEASGFYQRAFGLQSEFVAESGTYAQMATGATKLAFAAYTLGEGNFPGGVLRAGPGDPPRNVEIALVADDVDAAYARALEAGCMSLAEPADAPHGQRVSWVRDPFGTLIEIASPV
jgi:predicted enzyme related to lactoylglutathione lyase